MSEEWEDNFIEKAAQLEHIRWAKWQNYLHSFLSWNIALEAWVLPHVWKYRWQMQINTPYQMLSEKEKESDRKEARAYLPLICAEKQATRAEVLAEVQEKAKRRMRSVDTSDRPENYRNHGYNKSIRDHLEDINSMK